MKFAALILALAFGTGASIAPIPISAREPKPNGWFIHGEFDAATEWAKYKAAYHKSYSSPAEEAKRFGHFQTNLANADTWNDEQVSAGGSPVFGVTKFSDRSQEEFDASNKGRKGHGYLPEDYAAKTYRSPQVKGGMLGLAATPRAINWAALGYTTPVKNQGQCGSCWANSATEQIESQWMLAGNAPWPLSVQQVTSCTQGTFGCGGGDTTGAYEQLMTNVTKDGIVVGGVASAAMAPYEQSMYEVCEGPKCTVNCADVAVGNLTDMIPDEALTGYFVGISDYSFATPACDGACEDQDLTTLTTNVGTVGPASVCVNAGRWSLYVGGVMTTAACGGYAYDDLDHCVQLTGYDLTQAAEPYFIVRNSWATNWGNDGFIYLSAEGNTCGLADEATFVDIIQQ